MSHLKKLSSSYRAVVFFLIATQLLCEVKYSFGGDGGKDGSDAGNGMYRRDDDEDDEYFIYTR